MKACITAAALSVVCLTLTGQAQEMSRFRIGAHGAYSIGGDIEESKAGYGAQMEVALTKNIGVELAVSRFSDEASEGGISLEQDLTTIGLSLVGRVKLVQNLHGFLLAGVDYNIPDTSVSVDSSVSKGIPMTMNVHVDNAVGYHLGVGLNMPIQKNWELFAEYRYTFLKLEGDVSASAMGVTASEKIDGDYNFGLFMVGVNYLF